MHGIQSYQQSLPLAWLQAPSEHDRASLLEFVRGSLYSLSASNEKRREVHVARIRGAFDKLGAPALHRVGLKLLGLFREAELLFGGYWLPAPFRIVEVEDQHVFIGAVPTALGFLGKVENEGLCRLLASDVAAQFPRQSIDSWMGIAPTDPASLVESFSQGHGLRAVPITSQAELEYLAFVSAHGGRRFVWGSRPNVALAGHQIAVCRQKYFGGYRYFSAGLRSGRAISEATIEQSIPRLAFALAGRAGKPVVAQVRNGFETVEVTVAERLPAEEYRLAMLLSREIVRHGSTTYHLAPRLAPALIKRLIGLGCELETYK